MNEQPGIDIFVSYAREDRDCAERLAGALGERGWRVWWDTEIATGERFDEVIAERLAEAKTVVVLWSTHSARSGFVKDEAGRARDAGKLHPVRIDESELPLGFGQIQTLDLPGCDPDDSPESWERLNDELRAAIRGVRRASDRAPRQSLRQRWMPRWPVLAAVAAAAVAGSLGYAWWSSTRCEEAFDLTISGINSLEEGRAEVSVEFLNRAIASCPSQSAAWRYRGEAYARLLESDLALNDLRRAVTLGLDERGRRRVDSLIASIEGASAPAAGAPAPAPEPLPAPAPEPLPAPKPAEPPSAAAPAVRPPPAQAAAAPRPRDGELEATVARLFDPDKDARIAATTGLLVDSGRRIDAAPIALRMAQERIDNKSGVINTLVLLQSVGPRTLQTLGDPLAGFLERAQANGPQTAEMVERVRAAIRPIVFLQIGSERQRGLAKTIQANLRDSGYEVPAIENISGKATVPSTLAEVRVQGQSSRGAAELMSDRLERLGLQRPKIVGLRGVSPARDTYEIWIDAASCMTPERTVPACGP